MITYLAIGAITSLILSVIVYRSMNPVRYMDHILTTLIIIMVFAICMIAWPILLAVAFIAFLLYVFTNVFAT